MRAPAHCAPPDTWTAYVRALGLLHDERDAAARTHRAEQHAEGERAAELAGLTQRLTDQQRALIDLADRLGAPVRTADLSPLPVPALPEPARRGSSGPGGLADLQARIEAADVALAAVAHVAALPQLLPEWPGRFARAAVVYAGFAVPSLLLTVMLSLAGVGENSAVLLWFAAVWPSITAVVGGQVVLHAGRPRLAPEQVGEPEQGGHLGAGGSRRSEPRYWWFGVLLAWASWLVPGALLDWFAVLGPG